MKATILRRSLLAAVLALVASACGKPAGADTPDDSAVLALGIKNAVLVEDHVISSGQPTPEQFAALSESGFTTVIGLRVPEEEGTGWEEDAADAAGLAYVRIPIAGGGALEFAKGEELDAAITAAQPGGVLVVCGSGNRVGALFALRAASVKGASAEEAYELGRAAGMTSTDPRVRELLGLPPGE